MTPNERKIRLLKTKRKILTARDNLLDFATYMRPDMKDAGDPDKSVYQAAKHHEFMAHELERLERGDIKRLIISCPPRAGKSELAQKTFVPWVMGRNPDWHVITATYNSNFAGDFGRAVRGLIQDPRYQNVFPKVAVKSGSASVDRIETELGAVSTFVGRGGSLTGRGGHLIVVDDPLKDRVEADSPTIRDKLWQWWTQVLSTRLMTDEGRILIIMTRWHEDDIVGRITDPNNTHYSRLEAQRWTVINLPALAEDNDPLGRKPGESLWPQRFSTNFLANIRNQDPRGFSALYQGHPAPEEGLFFAPQDLPEYQHAREFPKDIPMFVASDHAVSTEQWADKSAFVVFGVDEEDTIWIHHDTVLAKIPADQTVDTMLRLMQRHRPVFWWAETGHISKSIGPFLRKRMTEERVYCSLIELASVKDKQTRAQSIKGRMSMQKVMFPAYAPWYEEARNQILTFPAGSKDDFVDALSLVGTGMNFHTRPRHRKKPAEITPGTFGHLMQQSNRDRFKNKLVKMQDGW